MNSLVGAPGHWLRCSGQAHVSQMIMYTLQAFSTGTKPMTGQQIWSWIESPSLQSDADLRITLPSVWCWVVNTYHQSDAELKYLTLVELNYLTFTLYLALPYWLSLPSACLALPYPAWLPYLQLETELRHLVWADLPCLQLPCLITFSWIQSQSLELKGVDWCNGLVAVQPAKAPLA
jgi:hypothetical protein